MRRIVPTDWPSLLVLTGMFMLCSPVSRADSVDLVFVRDSKEIMKAVRDLGGEFVAVLKFEVQIGDAPASFEAGLGNTKLANKLENLLLIANDPNDPTFVLTGAAAKMAMLPPNTTWRTPEGRQKIATISGLTLAWDEKQTNMTPDVFVTGQLKVDPANGSARVTLFAFSRKDPGKLCEIYASKKAPPKTVRPTLPSDRSILSLAGMSYAVDRSITASGDADQAAVEQASTQIKKPMDFAELLGQSPVKLEILLNGQIVAPKSDPLMPGGGRIESKILTGDKIEFRLTNMGDKTYAVVLAVNGRNTNSLGRDYHLNALDSKDQRKWLLAPGEQATVQGFYVDQKGQYRPFEILGDANAAMLYSSLSENYRGLITMHVFGEKRVVVPAKVNAKPLKTTSEELAAKKDEQEASVVTLGLGGSALEEIRVSGNLEVAKARIQNLTNVLQSNGNLRVDPGKVTNIERGLIVESESIKSGSAIEKVQFPIDVSPVAFVQVRYYGK